MKGIILAGGLGTRLFPSTKVTNKHLLPVYNQPMIMYPIRTLTESGIRDILIVSSRQHVGDFIELLGSGEDFNAKFTFKVQEGAEGIGHALALAEDFIKDSRFALILGDNIFTENFKEEVDRFQDGAMIFLKETDAPERFGIAEVSGQKVISIEEKPIHPKSNYAVTGLYFYDNKAFQYLKKIEPSARGELEITDLNKRYVEDGKMEARFLKGDWMDAGTHEALLSASVMVQERSPEYVPMKKEKATAPKVVAGLLLYETDTYQSEKYFDPCFTSLLKQDYPGLEIYVLDNGSPVKTGIENLKKKFPEIHFLESDKNLGFGGGHNFIIRNTASQGSPFYACLNFDMIFEPDFISKLVDGIRQSADISAVTGKLKRWDFERFMRARSAGNMYEDGKTNFIDTAGLRIRKSHRFEDRGQGEVDYGQYDKPEQIFGSSGAASLLRRTAIESIAFTNDHGEKEYFDELFFMYKEDIDLAYRMQWAGWKAFYIPQAVAYHDRSVFTGGNDWLSIMKNRRKKSASVNEWSFLNQEILLAKHFENRGFSRGVKNATKWYKIKSFLYIMLFEPNLLRQFRRLNEMSEQIEKRVLRMPRQVSEKEIEKFML